MKKTTATILVIDDDEDVLFSAELLLKRNYTRILTDTHPRDLNQLISKEKPDLVLLDMNYRVGFNDGEEGLYWLSHIQDINPEIPVILMTAYGEVELAVQALKMGANDFILKPWKNEQLLEKIEKALEQSGSKNARLKKKNKNIQEQSQEEFRFVIGESDAMKEVMQVVEKVSATTANVLLLGESGTGKQHIARKIHAMSDRKDKAFIHVDLGSLSENLFESELFGHRRGAFTDAKEDKKGRFEMAAGGTIFLDEIGNLPLNLQAKLLMVLQDRKVSRIGEGEVRRVDARFIFATNAPLAQWVEEGKFREDLMYRINTIEVSLPPLRERKEDIREFIKYYVRFYAGKYDKEGLKVERGACKMLKTHNWPGNIRELQHAIERAVIMSEGDEIKVSDFKLKKTTAGNSSSDLENLNIQDIEKLLIEKALSKHTGNISKAAKDLGLTRAALYRRMEKYNL
ncbi:MAG: sigma-54 dependent transcriptional regulator [Bacteroidota bacterium]